MDKNKIYIKTELRNQMQRSVTNILNKIDNKIRSYHPKARDLMINKPISFLFSCLITSVSTTKHFYSANMKEGLAIWIEFLCVFIEVVLQIELEISDITFLERKLQEIYKDFGLTLNELKKINNENSNSDNIDVEGENINKKLNGLRKNFIVSIKMWIEAIYKNKKYKPLSNGSEELEFINFITDESGEVKGGISWIDDCAKYVWLMYHIIGSIYYLSEKNTKCFLIMLRDMPLLIGCGICKEHYISTCFPLIKQYLLLNATDTTNDESSNKLDELFIKVHNYIKLSIYYVYNKDPITNQLEIETKTILDEDITYLYQTYLKNIVKYGDRVIDTKKIAHQYRQYSEQWYNLYY